MRGRRDVVLAALLCGMLASGCATGTPVVGKVSPSPFAKPVELVRDDLAARTGTSVGQITVVSVQPTVWPDSCLGLPAPEMCAPTATDGYVIELAVNGEIHVYHTDRDEAWRYAGLKR